jgi:membrane fusion protein (multidrug efflux system)
MLCVALCEAPASAENVAVDVHVAQATTGTAEFLYHSLGEIISAESIEITSTTPGTIEQLFFTDGQKVTKGDPLVQMDRRVADTLLRNSEAQLELARQTFERTRDLVARELRTKADLQRDTAALASAQADRDAKKTSLDVLMITAPFDGVLTNRVASVGAFINPGQPIVKLQSVKRLQLKFKVPQYLFNDVAVGQTVRVSSNIIKSVLETRVSHIDAVLDADTRLVSLQADIADTHDRPLFTAGTFARIELVLSTHKDAVLVPDAAINRSLSGDFIFVANGGKAERRAVVTGSAKRGLTEIITGLAAGENVITDGQFKLEDGGSIRIN